MHEEFINFIISLIPTKLETYVGGGVAFVGVLLQHFIGEWNNQIEALLILMLIDYFTGFYFYKWISQIEFFNINSDLSINADDYFISFNYFLFKQNPKI